MPKKWYQSRTLLTNGALLVVFTVGATVDAAGIFHISPEVVAGLGIFAGVVNLGLRLATTVPIAGAPPALAGPPTVPLAPISRVPLP